MPLLRYQLVPWFTVVCADVTVIVMTFGLDSVRHHSTLSSGFSYEHIWIS